MPFHLPICKRLISQIPRLCSCSVCSGNTDFVGFVITKLIELYSVEFQDYVLVVFVLAIHIFWALSLPNELCLKLAPIVE